MPTTPYTIRLGDDLREALEQEARLEDRSPAQLATRAIKTMLDAKASRRAAIDAALEEVDAGEVISEQAMTRWIDSWGTEDEPGVPQADKDTAE